MKASGDRQELQFAPLEQKFVPSFSDSEEVDDAAEEDGKKRESQSQDDAAHAAKRVKPDPSTAVKGEQDEVQEVEQSFEEALEAEVEHFLQEGDQEAVSGSPSFLSDNEEVKEVRPTVKVVLLRGKGLVTLENVVQYALYKAGLYKYYVDRCVGKTLEALDFEELTALIEQAKKHSQLISFMKQTHQREDVPPDWIRCFGSAEETAGDELRFFVMWLAYDSLDTMDGKDDSMDAESALEKAVAPSGPEVPEAANDEGTKGPIEPKESIEKSEVAKDGKNSTDAEAALEKAGAEETKGPIEPKESIEKSGVAKDGKNSTDAEAALEKAGAPSGPEVSEAAMLRRRRGRLSQRSRLRLRSQKLPRVARIPRVLNLPMLRRQRDRLSQRSRLRNQTLHMIPKPLPTVLAQPDAPKGASTVEVQADASLTSPSGAASLEKETCKGSDSDAATIADEATGVQSQRPVSSELEAGPPMEVQRDVAPKEPEPAESSAPVNPKKMEKEEGEKKEGAGAGRSHLENKGNDKDAHAIGLCNGQWSQCQWDDLQLVFHFPVRFIFQAWHWHWHIFADRYWYSQPNQFPLYNPVIFFLAPFHCCYWNSRWQGRWDAQAAAASDQTSWWQGRTKQFTSDWLMPWGLWTCFAPEIQGFTFLATSRGQWLGLWQCMKRV